MPLILNRKVGQVIYVGEDVEIQVVEIKGKRVGLAITAPEEVDIVRAELIEEPADDR